MNGRADRDGKQVVLLGGAWSPLGWSVGFIEAPLWRVRRRLVRWRHGLGADLEVRAERTGWPDCVSALVPLESPWTTELLVAHRPGWTVYLNNQIDGGDPWPATSYVAGLLRVRWVVAQHQPMTAVGHAATSFWLGGPDGQPPLRYRRVIDAHAEDGRWSWHASGEPLPFEQPDAYQARRIADRFTRQHLVGYLAAINIAVDDPGRYGAAVRVRQRVNGPTCQQTLREARRTWQLDPDP